MRFDTRALPMVGPARHLGRLAATTPPRQPDRPHPTGGPPTAGPTAGGVVIDGRVAHGVALTVAKLPGLRWKG